MCSGGFRGGARLARLGESLVGRRASEEWMQELRILDLTSTSRLNDSILYSSFRTVSTINANKHRS
jgi:hypothetical protein